MSQILYFSGFGVSHGEHLICNERIEKAVFDGIIGGFSADRIESSPDYQKYVNEHGEISPFQYFVTQKMGFKTRYHVVTFPPTKEKFKTAKTSLDLAVEALEQAFSDSGVDPETVDLWLAGCATPHEQAPGIAATIKCHFVGFENQTPAVTINSACVGFNINLQRAVEFFQANPEAKHVAIVHTEVMSQLLTNEPSFVPYATFADAAAAVILSRTNAQNGKGLFLTENREDMYMIDFLGANKAGDLYMNPTKVRQRATVNIANIVASMLSKSQWDLDSIDIFIPHQTGHAIVHSAAKLLGIHLEKVFQDVQLNFGNLSGASVPFAMALLKQRGLLKPGTKIATAVCGLGGEYGGFLYEVPELAPSPKVKPMPLKGKNVLVTGATGGLGATICKILAEKGANIYFHYNSNQTKANQLITELQTFGTKIIAIQADFANAKAYQIIVDAINEPVHYVIHTAAITGNLLRASEVKIEEMQMVNTVNYYNPMKLTEALKSKIKECVVFVGSVAEEAMFSGSSSYVSSKRQLHAFAQRFANQAVKDNVRCIYYRIGLLDKGMVEKLSPPQQITAMNGIGQKQLLNTEKVAQRIVKSLYLPKVINVTHTREGELIVRRDGF